MIEQLIEGQMYESLNKTISINILNFNIIENSESYHNKYEILNSETGKDDKFHGLFELH